MGQRWSFRACWFIGRDPLRSAVRWPAYTFWSLLSFLLCTSSQRLLLSFLLCTSSPGELVHSCRLSPSWYSSSLELSAEPALTGAVGCPQPGCVSSGAWCGGGQVPETKKRLAIAKNPHSSRYEAHCSRRSRRHQLKAAKRLRQRGAGGTKRSGSRYRKLIPGDTKTVPRTLTRVDRADLSR